MKSIVVMLSTYNGSNYLDAQLYSLHNQNCNCKISLYVRDDGSKDDTLSILNRWKDRLDIYILKGNTNCGPAMSFWTLLEQVPEADYYAFMDQDDVWDCNKLDTAILALGSSNKPILWCCNCRTINESGNIISNKKHRKPPILTIPSQLVCGSIQGCAMVFNSTARHYVLDKHIACIPMHDLVIMTYILASGAVLYEPKPLFSYRLHQNNVIAKQGKHIKKRLCNTINNWFSDKNGKSILRFSQQLLEDNEKLINSDTKTFIEELIRSKNRMWDRIVVLNNPLLMTQNRAGLRSFKIRVLLGIL